MAKKQKQSIQSTAHTMVILCNCRIFMYFLHFTSYNPFIVLEHSINRGVYNGSNICGPILERFGGEIPPNGGDHNSLMDPILNKGFQGEGIVFNCSAYTQTTIKTGLIFAHSLVAQSVHIYVA